MNARPRKSKYKGLEPNLYYNASRRIYRYKHPVNKTWHQMGSDRNAAQRAARILNARLIEEFNLVDQVLGRAGKTVADAIERYRTEVIPGKNLKPASLKNTEYRLNRFEDEIGKRVLKRFQVSDAADYLDNFDGDAYTKHRLELLNLFRFAQTKGLVDANPVEPTQSTRRLAKQRDRLTLDDFQQIYKAAPEWLQIAMDLALITLQRRADVLAMRFDWVVKGSIRIKQGKTGTGLAIKLSGRLETVIHRARMSGVVTPFIVHRMPEKRTAGKEHWTKVTPDYLSKAFLKAKKDSVCQTTGTFHEIRSLGAHLYREQGVDPQSLLGHKSAMMTQHYLDGHEHWQEVRADLEV